MSVASWTINLMHIQYRHTPVGLSVHDVASVPIRTHTTKWLSYTLIYYTFTKWHPNLLRFLGYKATGFFNS